jgi:hypothetical protein
MRYCDGSKENSKENRSGLANESDQTARGRSVDQQAERRLAEDNAEPGKQPTGQGPDGSLEPISCVVRLGLCPGFNLVTSPSPHPAYNGVFSPIRVQRVAAIIP